jgi:hypothetical protein
MHYTSYIRIATIIFSFALCGNYQAKAQKNIKYPVSEIPKELLEESKAVVREDITQFEVIDKGNGKSYTKYAVTILNKKADYYGEVRIAYDNLRKITSLKARSFDKNGRLIKQLKSKDIKDYAAHQNISSYSDNRLKYFDLRYADYPYTIEYEIEKDYNGLLSLPGWVPYSGFNISSQQSSLEIKAPEDYDIRYLERNIDPIAKESIIDGKKIVSWEFGSFKAMEREPRMPFLQYISPTVITAPSNFEMEDYEGSMKDWASFGLWEKQLNDGRDVLPLEDANKIKAMVEAEPSRIEKIKKLYEYLQNNTRYISIQLGIGGWQTFPATDVASKGYGDCKALSNYMKSMLKSVDIESYYTLVKAGRNTANINKDFPSNQFNHMILCVPNYQDTIWLECTSQDNPFGYLGGFTDDRDVLVINENGGGIAHTKIYGIENNKQNQITNVVLNENGSATASLSVACTGLQYDNYSRLLDIGEGEQKKWLYKNLDFPGFELLDFKFGQQKKMIPEVSAAIDVTINRFASVSGKRLFFQPNVVNKTGNISIPQKDRKFDFVLSYPFEDMDTVEIQIPESFHLEFIPEKTTIESSFGTYESHVFSEEGKITYVRKFSLVKGTFPPEEYIKFVKFINKVAKADKSKLVLVKST